MNFQQFTIRQNYPNVYGKLRYFSGKHTLTFFQCEGLLVSANLKLFPGFSMSRELKETRT